MKKHVLFIGLSLLTLTGFAQSVGDTIVVQAFNYESTTRDTMIDFPSASGVKYEKILMLYSMRCKDGLVSTGNDRNLGCGEWDYSCNTNIVDSSRVDSVKATTNSHSISGFSGTIFDYVSNPVNDYYQYEQTSVTINNIIADTSASVGSGTLSLDHVVKSSVHAGKAQYLFTAAELTSAGLYAGGIDALSLNVSSNPENVRDFKVSMKETMMTMLSDTNPELTGFTEVFFQNTPMTAGSNRVQFHTPFAWDGTSNIIVEITFTNKTTGGAITFEGSAGGSGLISNGDYETNFLNGNYINTYGYKGVTGSQNRTMEAWIKTTEPNDDIMGWGVNSTGQKWLMRLDGNGILRTEINGGFAVGSTVINDGEWHHVAVVLDGDNTTDLVLYVDGVQETISSVGARTINTASNLNVTVGRAANGNLWNGQIAEARVWSTNLDGSTIRNWMHRELDNTHMNYANIELYFPLNDGSGQMAMDASGNGRNGTFINGATWSQLYGPAHFKNLEEVSERPNVTFHQGLYDLTIALDTVVDTVAHLPNVVTEYQVFPKTGTLQTDSIGAISVTNLWEANSENTYAPNGTLISSVPVTETGTINITQLNYWTRSASAFEIMSFVTPYGIGLDMGIDGETWTFDLTDYTPFLNGKKRIYLNRGGQWQEDMDIKFLFIVGTPPRDVIDVKQIWKVNQVSYSNIQNQSQYEPRDMVMHPDGKSYKVRSVITGHGQQGEFIPRQHSINVNGGNTEFAWQVWMACGENPIYPQGGTWVYDRAGWCPGMASMLMESDITPHVSPGQVANLEYTMASASGDSRYIVNHQLVTYGEMNHTYDVAMAEIVAPTQAVEHRRYGGTCFDPIVRIQNTGSATLNTVEISYWVNDATKPNTYTWTGTLESLETVEVTLPQDIVLWDAVTGITNTFHAKVSLPDATDEYMYNDEISAEFNVPEVLPNSIIVEFKTNNNGGENSYQVVDAEGTVVLTRSNLASNTVYKDTLNLPWGCYKLEVLDSGNDGLQWWANPNQGSGYVRFWEFTGSGQTFLKTLEPDFGSEITYNFTIDSPLSTEKVFDNSGYSLYPNPAQNFFVVEGVGIENTKIHFYDVLGHSIEIPFELNGDKVTFKTDGLAKGMYFVNILHDTQVSSFSVIVE